MIFTFLGVIAVVGAIVVSAISGITPPFIIQGVGSTLVGKAVLITAIVFFGTSAALSIKHYFKSGSVLLRWYATGVTLVAIGLTGVLLQKSVGSPVGWVGRTSQYIGAVCILIGVLSFWRAKISSGLSLEATFEEITRKRISELEQVNNQLRQVMQELNIIGSSLPQMGTHLW